MGRFIRIVDGRIVSVRFANEIVAGEIESETGNTHQIQVGGEWVDPPPEAPDPAVKSLQEQVDALQSIVDMLLIDALGGV